MKKHGCTLLAYLLGILVGISAWRVVGYFMTLLHVVCLQARWGSFNLVEASRTLLAAALKDPLNQRFVLLSESCVPLYSPQVVYMQLLSEAGSRVDACGRTVRKTKCRWV